MFKVGEKVFSVLNGQETDQIGTVTEVTDSEVIVSPVDYPFVKFSYDLKGDHRTDTKFSIRKVKRNNK